MRTLAPPRIASALSHETDAGTAGQALVDAILPQFQNASIDLACVFFSAHHARNLEKLLCRVQEKLQTRVMVGCTGEGVIEGHREIETGPAAALWAATLPGATVHPLRLAHSQLHDQLNMQGWPDSITPDARPSVFVLLADPFTTPMQDVLAMMKERYPTGSAIGGLAGGGREEGENRLILNENLYDGGLVGVALSGSVSVKTVVSQGCRPIGERFIITKAEHNMIHELGGSPALERLKTVYSSLSDHERALAHRALHIGIAMDEHRERFERGDFLVRNLIGADHTTGAIAIGDVVQEGQTVQFHVRDARSADEDLHLLLAAERAKHKHAPLGALLFSCCGRGQGLFGRPHHDVSVLREQLGGIPVAGFFAQGEIGPVGGCNFLHGYTASVALFSSPNS